LLAAVNLTPYVTPLDLGDPTEYVPRLCGWINRLNEIRERLRCSACGSLMKPNYKYAKNLARYNATVVSCDGGPAHDGDVYLNHCWACRTIIDSRDCRIRIDGYYLCLKCGSGPQHSKTFRQGDLCPKCGGTSMDGHRRNWTCRRCYHTIRLPSEFRMTGPRNDVDFSDPADSF
jgi:ribosomal protein S27AE